MFGRWKPWGVFGASLLFGVFYGLQLHLQAMTNSVIPYQFWQALPYVATLVVLVSLGAGRAHHEPWACPTTRGDHDATGFEHRLDAELSPR